MKQSKYAAMTESYINTVSSATTINNSPQKLDITSVNTDLPNGQLYVKQNNKYEKSPELPTTSEELANSKTVTWYSWVVLGLLMLLRVSMNW